MHKYSFKRGQEFSVENLSVHFIAYNDGEVVLDQLISIENGEEKASFDWIVNSYDCYEYWIFNKDGKLIDRNKLYFIKSFPIGMSFLGNQYKLSDQNFSKNSSLKGKVRTLGIVSHHSEIKIDFEKDYADKQVGQKMNFLYQNLKKYSSGIKEDENGRWFKKGGGVNELVKYLNKITGSGSYEMITIDPFISSTASLDYLLCLTNVGLKLKFISCWKGENPDTRKSQKIPQNILETKSALTGYQDYKMIPLANVTWHNLKKSEFHDRFIYIKNTNANYEENEQVYLLSNSLNSLLQHYDFCIIPLKGEVKRKALEHINHLQSLCSNAKLVYPEAT